MWPLQARVNLGGSDNNEGVLRIPQSSNITETSPPDCFVSYPGHSLEGIWPLCRGAVSVFYSPSQLYNRKLDWQYKFNFAGPPFTLEESLVLRRCISEGVRNSLNKTVIIKGISSEPVKIPLYRINMRCRWMLPMKGISLLLGNNVEGRIIYPEKEGWQD